MSGRSDGTVNTAGDLPLMAKMSHHELSVAARDPLPSPPTFAKVGPERFSAAKFTFVTRRVDRLRLESLVMAGRPTAGDLVLARVHRLGQHTSVQTPEGRRASLFVGDEVVLAYGARYAPDQYEGRVPNALSPCHLLAGGGIAGEALRWPIGIRKPTRIEPIGLLGDAHGRVVNLRTFALPPAVGVDQRSAPVIAVVGSSMNAGKTTAVASLIRGGACARLRVGAAKVTGTGASNDFWMYVDAGAEHVFDFTDCGYASTYLIGAAAVERVLTELVAHLRARCPELIVLEVADGLFQQETSALLRSPVFRNLVDGVIFCAADSMGARGGVEWLEQRGVTVLGVSGKLTTSPLAIREAAATTRLHVWRREDLADADLVRRLLMDTARLAQRVGACR